MKRDLDLYRRLLAHFEGLKAGHFVDDLSPEIFQCTAHEMVEHLELLIEQGFLKGEAKVMPHDADGGTYLITRLTGAGHDFLKVTRDETLWSNAKDCMKKAGSWTLGAVLEVLREEAKEQFGIIIKGGQ